jgi:cytochrome c
VIVRREQAAGVVACIALLMSACASNQPPPDPAALTGANADSGRVMLRRYGCASCHLIPGVPGARGQAAPSLAGVGRRVYIVGTVRNTPEHLMKWIMNPRSVDATTTMPNLRVTANDARHIAAYLYTLR